MMAVVCRSAALGLPLSLDLQPFECSAGILAVLVTALVCSRAAVSWLHGLVLVALYLLHESNPWGVTMLQVFMGGVVCAVIVMKGPKTGNLAAGKTMLEAMGPASIIMPIFGFVLVFAYHLQIGSGPGLDLVPFTTAGFVIAFIISTMIE